MAYSGIYQPINRHKYEGDSSNIVWRSTWERSLMRWLDHNPDVQKWQSEEFFIPYISPLDGKPHRYFVDFKVTFVSGLTLLIEVKPAHQTKQPVPKKGKKKTTLLMETQTYSVNWAKWNAAEKYAEQRGWKFTIMTEHTLKSLGVVIPSTQPRNKR